MTKAIGDPPPSGGHMAPLARPDLVNPLIAAVLDETIVDISS
ncbi:MAG TPA: hypothetical protein VGQ63_22430 [Pseudolabrys sp.]|nr:hypothetical protein [Pseudolabrys sp.]